ncbi:hypothetical protein [Thermodesulfovibrio thiophilus]|uniref:hypothetical protein n=1 Tax=Thermodesulfovibrio thiophilus TaxID=340095 RepID=UPI000419E862|nr:hypothetical protein [Thermodesulfovibrio thiophilus]
MLHVFYAKNSGVELSVRDGKINLRFFTFGNGENKKARFVLDPVEAFHTNLAIVSMVRGKSDKFRLIHKYNEVTSTVTVEKWQKNEKSGYAVVYKKEGQNEININVPLDQVNFLFLAELLKKASIKAVEDAEALENQKQEQQQKKEEKTVIDDEDLQYIAE